MRKKIVQFLSNDYILTLATSAVSILLSFALSGVFARIFDEENFLMYNLLARYLGFFQAVLSGMIGFGIIHMIKKSKESLLGKIIANFSGFYFIFYLLILCFVLVLFRKNGLVFNTFEETIFIISSFWFLGESFKHMFNFLLRGNNQFNLANVYTLSINVGVIGFCIFLTWKFSLAYYEYQFLVGILAILVSIGVVFFIKNLKWSRPLVDKKLVKSILKFSVSRWVENMFRLLFIVCLLAYLSFSGEQELAGYVALLFTLIKMSESALQAFITVIFSKSANMSQAGLKRQFIIQTIVALGFSLVLMGLFWGLGEFIVNVWLGEKYIFLTPYFQKLSFALFAVISVFIYKGVFENFFQHSPLMILNLMLIVSIAFLPLLEISLANIVWFMVVVFWIRFFAYLSIVMKKLDSLGDYA